MNKMVKVPPLSVSDLQYCIFSGQTTDPAFRTRHDSAYRMWRETWRQTFGELRSEAVPKADDFVRAAYIGGLFAGNEAVGLLLHSRFHLPLLAVQEHHYLQTYPKSVLEMLQKSGIESLFTMESLTVHPGWRRANVAISLGEILVGLGVRIFERSGAEGALAVTRNEKKVNDTFYGHGAKPLAQGLRLHNVAVDLACLRAADARPSPNPEVNQWVSRFWAAREDYAPPVFSQTMAEPNLTVIPGRKAA